MKTLGRHLILEYYQCAPDLLDDISRLSTLMRAAATSVGATVVGEAFHAYEPQGVSGTLLIAESHLSLHTWPEAGYVAVDLFTCGGLDPRPALELFYRGLGAASCRMQEIVRGLPEDLTGAALPSDVEVVAHAAKLIVFDSGGCERELAELRTEEDRR
ncbi:MAG: adenosylmethionine decarboxylase [Polyangiaceae bacterium]|nr:adenosylmethionine decarboxylase [Polyangiaceae bacterium]